MPISYDMLFGAPTDEERMRANADRLRRREAFATLGTFTGDPVLGQWGRGEMENVREQAQALRKARQEAMKPRPTGTPGWLYSQARGPFQLPGYADQQEAAREAAHRRDLELAQVKADTALQRTMEKERMRREAKASVVPEATWRQVSDPLNWTQSLEGIIPLVEESEDISMPRADVAADFGRKMGLGGLVNLAEPMYRGEEAMSLRSMIQRVLTRLRAGEFGAALTKFEIEEFGKEDPLAPGVDKARLVDRLKRTVEFVKGQARLKIAGRKPPGNENIEWLYENPWEQEAGVAAPEGTVTETETTLPSGWTVREK